MRKDKAKNVDLVASEIVKNPFHTVRDIAKNTGLGVSTTSRAIKEVEQTGMIQKDDRIVNLTNKDLEIVTKAQQLIADKFGDEELVKKMKVTDISSVAKDSSARYTVFKGSVTDKDGGMIGMDVTGMSLKELDEIRRQLLSKNK